MAHRPTVRPFSNTFRAFWGCESRTGVVGKSRSYTYSKTSTTDNMRPNTVQAGQNHDCAFQHSEGILPTSPEAPESVTHIDSRNFAPSHGSFSWDVFDNHDPSVWGQERWVNVDAPYICRDGIWVLHKLECANRSSWTRVFDVATVYAEPQEKIQEAVPSWTGCVRFWPASKVLIRTL